MARGKAKGSQYEREVSTLLSFWVSDFRHDDLFWRSASSGGRATTRRKAGKAGSNHAGDIAATRREGEPLCQVFLIECKRYRKFDWVGDFYGNRKRAKDVQSPAGMFLKAVQEARETGRLAPLCFFRENNRPELGLTNTRGMRILTCNGEFDIPVLFTLPFLDLHAFRIDSLIPGVPFKSILRYTRSFRKKRPVLKR